MKTVLAIIFLIASSITLYITGIVAFVDIFLSREIFISPIATTIVSLVGGAVSNLLVFVVIATRARSKAKEMRDSFLSDASTRSFGTGGGPGRGLF